MPALSKADQMKVIAAIPESKLIELSHIINNSGQGMRGGNFGDDVLSFLKNTFTTVAPALINSILIPLIQSKVGLGMRKKKGGSKRGCGLSLSGTGLKLSGQGKRDTGKGSEAMKIKMAKVRAAKKK